MRLEHVDLMGSDFQIQSDMTLEMSGEKISAIGKDIPLVPADEEIMDLRGLTLYPGFIDLHVHGAMNEDASDANVGGLRTIAAYLASKGVTTFCPTTMMISREAMGHVFMAAEVFAEQGICGARMEGLRLEGPFLSEEKCGVQYTEYAEWPNEDYLKELLKNYPENLVRIIDISPELPGAIEFIEALKDKYVFSVAHTAATYDQTRRAIQAGARNATHLFNAMNPLHHHEPGAVGAFLSDTKTTCELICDGKHVHPVVLNLALKLLGEDRTVVVSDSMRAAGMPDGEYDLGGRKIQVRSGTTDMGDGRLAGSTTNIYVEFLNLLRIGVPLPFAIKACSLNPAKVLKIDHLTGSIEVDKYADLIAMDNRFHIRKVWVRGTLVYDSEKSLAVGKGPVQ